MKENTLTELTDVDSKLLRTILHLFINPKKVIDATEDEYTSPVSYAFTLMGFFAFIFLFLDDLLLPNILRSNEWRIPLRLQDYLEQSIEIENNFSGFFFALCLICHLRLILALANRKVYAFQLLCRIVT